MTDRARIRRIIKLAAKEAPSARSWLVNDEFGTWERRVGEYLDRAEEHPVAKTMTVEAVDKEIAVTIALLALEALLRDAKGNAA